MTNPGEKEEATYIRQVQSYRRRFVYTMVHDRRDRRAEVQSHFTVGPMRHESVYLSVLEGGDTT